MSESCSPTRTEPVAPGRRLASSSSAALSLTTPRPSIPKKSSASSLEMVSRSCRRNASDHARSATMTRSDDDPGSFPGSEWRLIQAATTRPAPRHMEHLQDEDTYGAHACCRSQIPHTKETGTVHDARCGLPASHDEGESRRSSRRRSPHGGRDKDSTIRVCERFLILVSAER